LRVREREREVCEAIGPGRFWGMMLAS